MSTPAEMTALPLHNFRDVGGLRTSDGRRTAAGVLFRSDSPHGMGDEEVGHLVNALRVRTLVDLRSDREVEGEGHHAELSAKVTRHHLPIAGGPGNAIESAADGERLAARYDEYLEQHTDSLVGAVRAIARTTHGASLVHCRAGKDRTGVVVALVLSAVGVVDDDVVRDYELTTSGMVKILAELRRSETYAANTRRLPDEMYRSDAATMTAFLRILDERHGGAGRWLLGHGLEQDDLDSLVRHLVGEPAPEHGERDA